MVRTLFLALAASVCAKAQNPSTRSGQAFPARAARIVVDFAPGGATDVTARLLAIHPSRLPITLREFAALIK